MAVYVIASVDVVDSEGYEEYRRRVPSTIEAYGGRYLARGGATEVLEGTWSPERCVIVEDSVPGVTAAVAAGMTVIGFTGASHCRPGDAARLATHGAIEVIDDMAQLLPALAR